MDLISSEILENSVRTYSGELCRLWPQRRPGKQKHFATDAQGKESERLSAASGRRYGPARFVSRQVIVPRMISQEDVPRMISQEEL